MIEASTYGPAERPQNCPSRRSWVSVDHHATGKVRLALEDAEGKKLWVTFTSEAAEEVAALLSVSHGAHGPELDGPQGRRVEREARIKRITEAAVGRRYTADEVSMLARLRA